jgi:hypothetical protein
VESDGQPRNVETQYEICAGLVATWRFNMLWPHGYPRDAPGHQNQRARRGVDPKIAAL